MNKILDWRPLLGLLLILTGIIYLFQVAFHVPVGSLFVDLILGVGGVIFLLYYLRNRRQWWAIFPGVILLFLAFGGILDVLFPRFAVNFGGFFFLFGLGLSFLIVYLLNFANWWAIIPSGVMFTLAAVSLLEPFLPSLETGGIFFLGLGLTFGVLSVIPTGRPGERMQWALVPAGVLIVMGLIFAAVSSPMTNLIWPLLLILVGLFFLYRTLIGRRA
jgi:hypothetical protein